MVGRKSCYRLDKGQTFICKRGKGGKSAAESDGQQQTRIRTQNGVRKTVKKSDQKGSQNVDDKGAERKKSRRVGIQQTAA